MVNKKTMSEQQQIEEILEEANAFGLRKEVKELAETMISEYGGGTWGRVFVYDFAYKKYIEGIPCSKQ